MPYQITPAKVEVAKANLLKKGRPISQIRHNGAPIASYASIHRISHNRRQRQIGRGNQATGVFVGDLPYSEEQDAIDTMLNVLTEMQQKQKLRELKRLTACVLFDFIEEVTELLNDSGKMVKSKAAKFIGLDRASMRKKRKVCHVEHNTLDHLVDMSPLVGLIEAQVEDAVNKELTFLKTDKVCELETGKKSTRKSTIHSDVIMWVETLSITASAYAHHHEETYKINQTQMSKSLGITRATMLKRIQVVTR